LIYLGITAEKLLGELYPPFECAFDEVHFDLVKGLKLKSLKGQFGALDRKHTKNDLVEIDYASEVVNLKLISIFNGYLACRGKVNSICWTGTTFYEIFECPEIEYKMTNDWIRDSHQDLSAVQIMRYLGKQDTCDILKENGVHPFTYSISNTQRYHIIQKIKNQIAISIKDCQDTFKSTGVVYIGPNDNPGRQFTASFNPVYGNIRDYLRPGSQVHEIGISHEVYWLLVQILKQCVGYAGRDVMFLLLKALAKAQIENAVENLLIPAPAKPPKEKRRGARGAPTRVYTLD
jgi:hypothetical protein